MNESEPDRTENTAVSRSPWKSLAIVVLILASIAMPCSTLLQLKGGSSMFRIPPLLYGLWAAFSLWVALDAANFLRALDRKSTRLNSSHSQISYAVFCLK